MRKTLEFARRMDDYTCVERGGRFIIRDTGEMLPPKFFYYVLSNFGSFCYMKTPKAELKRMVALGDGRTRQMFDALARIYRACR